MAKLIKKQSDLVDKRNRVVAINKIGYALLLLGGILFPELAARTGNIPISCLMGIASLAGLLMIHFTRDTMGILSSGVEGEEKALKMIARGLPENFTCIHNAVIRYENRHNELDIIVVGPTGVYIVEVKNISGTLEGSYSSKTLQQVQRQGTKEMRNPVQQVRTHADILARFLRANGIQTWVQGIVLFVNNKCTPKITDIPSNGVSIFAVSAGGEQKLLEYLKNARPNSLSQQEIDKITSII